MLVEEAHDLISAHSTDVNAVFTFASGGFDRLLGMDPAVRRLNRAVGCGKVMRACYDALSSCKLSSYVHRNLRNLDLKGMFLCVTDSSYQKAT